MTIKCYEFFGCKELECSMLEDGKERNCWEVAPAMTPRLKNIAGQISLNNKLDICKNCLYYQLMNSDKV